MEKKVYLSDVCNDRNNNLDLIRFIAAVLVLYSHAFPLSRGNEGELLKDLTNGRWSFGSMAVAIFFIISGFLISQSYDRTKNPIKFIKARVLRIFPALGVVLVLSVFVLGPLVTTLPVQEYFSNSSTYQYLKNIFLYPLFWNLPGVFENNFYSASVNGSLWTIPFEFYFYGVVLVFGILGLIKNKKANLALTIFFIGFYIYRMQIFPIEGHFMTLPRYSLLELGCYFSVGMLIYAFKEQFILDKHLAMISIVTLCFFVIRGEYVVSFTVFGAYLVMYFGFNPIVKLGGFSKYGDFSYGMYIFGFPIQQVFTNYFGGSMNPYLNFVLSFLVTLPLSIISWHLVEKRCLRLKNINFINMKFTKMKCLWTKIQKEYIYITEKIVKYSWSIFIVVCVLGSMGINYLYKIPNIITFPYANEHIFSDGWMEQSTSEEYRWISKKASVMLKQAPHENNLSIEGYIPENFAEINRITVYCDDNEVYEQDIVAGQVINISTNIPENNTSISKDIRITIEFNDVHIPEAGNQDVRELSALINRIYIQ